VDPFVCEFVGGQLKQVGDDSISVWSSNIVYMPIADRLVRLVRSSALGRSRRSCVRDGELVDHGEVCKDLSFSYGCGGADGKGVDDVGGVEGVVVVVARIDRPCKLAAAASTTCSREGEDDNAWRSARRDLYRVKDISPAWWRVTAVECWDVAALESVRGATAACPVLDRVLARGLSSCG